MKRIAKIESAPKTELRKNKVFVLWGCSEDYRVKLSHKAGGSIPPNGMRSGYEWQTIHRFPERKKVT